MPKLSLWKPDRGKDYTFIDRVIREHFEIGGTGVLVHKYLGPEQNTNSDDSSLPENKVVGPNNVQDLLLLENRDRKYDPDVFELRGVYTVADADFDLSQFGLFQTNDDVQITFHLNDMISRLGRRLMSGDVFELPHRVDNTGLEFSVITIQTAPNLKFQKGETVVGSSSNVEGTVINYNPEGKYIRVETTGDFTVGETVAGSKSNAAAVVSSFTPANPVGAMRKFYVVEDASREAAGYDPGWWPHIWKVKAKALQDTQEFRDVLGTGENADDIKNLLSTYQDEIDISDGIVRQAEAEVPFAGLNAAHLFLDESDASKVSIAYSDGKPPNGIEIKHTGTSFPSSINDGEYVLRTDYQPARLFRKQGTRYIKIEDDKRGSWSAANSVLNSFINNTFSSPNTSDGKERQFLSKVVKPKAD